MTEMRSQHNKMGFGPSSGGEYGDSAMGLDAGMIGMSTVFSVSDCVFIHLSIYQFIDIFNSIHLCMYPGLGTTNLSFTVLIGRLSSNYNDHE